MNSELLDNLRHSCAHLLAKAVLDLWPGSHNAIGPAIENGFYQDFDMGNVKVSEADLPKIEKKMRDILKGWTHFEYKEVNLQEARELFAHNPYKIELLEEFAKDGKKLLTNNPGGFLDLCKMTHVENPNKEMQHFKLLSIAGAYWRGSEKNKMLTRIYGTIWPTQKELDDYLNMLEESKKRDHKKLGPTLELFMFHETAPGMPYWLPKGLIILNELISFWRQEHIKRAYQEIKSPLINKKELYETSGHWDHYRENMFISEIEEGEIYALKPMNCPNAMIVFGSRTRSYKEFPLRLSDTDTLHRFELSGTLNGLMRVREFSQDDAHIFVTEDQIKQEFENLFEVTELFYSIFGLKYHYRLGTRPEKFMGDPKVWIKAEDQLKDILEKSGKENSVLEGDGAFYGPKIDIIMKDSLGRQWQMGTLQLDFQIPQRFNLKYAAADGTQKTPVVIHRVIYGSLERFIGILIEHYAGAFPTWLAPVQTVVMPISDKHQEYAQKVVEQLKEAGVRVELNDKNEPLNARIRDTQMQKIPYILVVGDKEIEANTVSVRRRHSRNTQTHPVSDFISTLKQEIANRTNN
ncbi:MAG: threonine--tRNA ligase [Patescibacteria group bacterium]